MVHVCLKFNQHTNMHYDYSILLLYTVGAYPFQMHRLQFMCLIQFKITHICIGKLQIRIQTIDVQNICIEKRRFHSEESD